jgi:Transposase DNA-binding
MRAKLPDARLEARLEQIIERLSAAYNRSIPQACDGSAAEMKAAYRFLG